MVLKTIPLGVGLPIADGVKFINDAIDRSNTVQNQLDTIIIESGTSDAEVIQARGEYQVLNDRMYAIALKLADKATKSEIQQASLVYKESYDTLALLKSAYPSGDVYNHVVLFDKLIYTYSSGDWISTGIQASGSGVADGTVTTEKTTFLNPTYNIFNGKTVTIGKQIAPDTGVISDSSTHSISDFINVDPGTDYYVSGLTGVRYYDENQTFLAGSSNLTGAFTIGQNTRKIRLDIINSYLYEYYLVKGGTAQAYIENGFNPIIDRTQFQTKKQVEIGSKQVESYQTENNAPQEKIGIFDNSTISQNNYMVLNNNYEVRWRNRTKSIEISVLASPATVNFVLDTPLTLEGVSEFISIVYIEDVTKVDNLIIAISGITWNRIPTSDLKNGWNVLRYQTSAGDISTWVDASQIDLDIYTNANTTIYVSDLIAIKPQKAKIIFVDDHGYSNFKNVAYPELKSRGIPVTWAINPGRLGAPIGSVENILSQSEIDELAYDPMSEFSYHAWDPTVNSSNIMTASELLEEHHKCTTYLKKNGLLPRYYWRAAFTNNLAPEHQALQPYLDAYATHDGSGGVELYPFRDKYNISRIGLHGLSQAALDIRFDKLKKTRAVLVLYTHGLDDAGGIHLTTSQMNYFLTKVDVGISEGWLEGTTYSRLRAQYTQKEEEMISIIL